jgi:hypothetical protein
MKGRNMSEREDTQPQTPPMKGRNMSEREDTQPPLTATEMETDTTATLPGHMGKISDEGEVGQEAVTSATVENPVVSAVIEERMKADGVPVTTEMLVATIKRIENELRKGYPDPERITVPVSSRTTIHHDFTRSVPPLPNHLMFPHPALVNGKAIQVGSVKVPAVLDEEGNELKAVQKLPIYVAAAPDGSPLRDSKGDFVVIDPQNGAIRQRVRGKGLVPKRSWWKMTKARIKAWWKSFKFDFKFIKKV